MKGYILSGIFKTRNNKYDYKIHYRYFEKGIGKILYKRVMHISDDEEVDKKFEMLRKAGFDIELFDNDVYLKCDDKEINNVLKKVLIKIH